ncbi:hypothetical protein AC578_3332 [Pseudocercospora eumusae]|uniref:Uncharacterized protein n=1 Tax=Pseudocercospora eumusae TaxID=321146 RepID=A0A139GVF6_9PEZI|nr:hypothetical protein AC578_3332 [Pseudocercospora eumusae]
MLTWSGMIALALLGLWHILQHLFGDNIARNDHAWSQWVQPACYDEELDHEFSHSGPGPAGQWTYYVEDEQDNRVALSASDISTLSQPLVSIWYSHERHIAHCVFQWRKLLQQQQQQQQSISSSLSVELQAHRERHIAHCTHAFLQRTDPEAITTNVVKNASACMGEL